MKRFNEQHFVEETLQHLSWNENTDKICKKITSGIVALNSLGWNTLEAQWKIKQGKINV